MPPDRTALLIIRAWVDQGSSKPLRVQIRLTNDLTIGLGSQMTFADIHAVSAAVETWLEDVVIDDHSGR
jgi:hypothetical protein